MYFWIFEFFSKIFWIDDDEIRFAPMAGTEIRDFSLRDMPAGPKCCLKIDETIGEIYFEQKNGSKSNFFSIRLRPPKIAEDSILIPRAISLENSLANLANSIPAANPPSGSGLGNSGNYSWTKILDVENETVYAFQKISADLGQIFVLKLGIGNKNQSIPLKNVTASGGVIDAKILARTNLQSNWLEGGDG